MSDLSRHNPTGRFTGLADVYAKHRPSYPAAALDFIVTRCRLRPGSVLVDVGCGTGISARLFAERGLVVIGVEPNDEMRQCGESATLPQGVTSPTYRKGRAEQTGLPDGTADAVIAAQAFHWFDATAALREFHRILKSGGWVALLWNERDEADPFTAAYGDAFGSVPGAAALEMQRGQAGEPLLVSPLFEQGNCTHFLYEQQFDEEGLLGRAFSASYAPREPAAAEMFAAQLRQVFARFQQGGRVTLRYDTSAYTARRNG